jgi:mono/diheme cytochrome c family protein
VKARAYAWLAIGVALLVGGVALYRFGLLSHPPEINPDDPAQVALGRQIYADNCARCHGANLEGEPNWQQRKPNGRLPAPPHDASGHTWHHPDRVLVAIVTKGMSAVVPGYQSDMPAFENRLTMEQIAAVLAFIESTWPPDVRGHQQALPQG